MPTAKIKDGIFSVGVLNPIMRIFDVVMTTDFGTTYNSYIVRGSDKIALIETCHDTYFDSYLQNIRAICEPSEIDYIILNHCEPDHSGALRRLAELCPKAQIIASAGGSVYLKNITNNPELKITVARDGDTLDLGSKTLKFITAPFLHWPDSMFTWCAEEKTLFSCDVFGAHYCEPQVFDYNIVYPKKYEEAFLGYYNAIFGPFKPYVLKGLEKIADLDIDVACTSHGPILTRGGRLAYAMDMYRRWSAPAVNPVATIPIFYCSAYGNTGSVAQAIASGIREGISNAKVDIFDVNEHPMCELQALLNRSDAFAIGSPTINGDAVAPIWNLLSHVDALNNKKKPVLVFGSYGWSGEAVPNLIARLNGLKTAVFEEGVKVIFVPSEQDLAVAKETGKRFAQNM